jgi:hypothetical protein
MLFRLGALVLVFAIPAMAKDLPPPADRPVDFAKDIAPLFQNTCVKCHAKGKDKGGFSLETRETFLKGGESGAAAEAGKSAESLIVELVAGIDPDSVMPKKGSRWTPEQVGLLRRWIDQGMAWDAGVTFAKPEPLNLKPNPGILAGVTAANPIDPVLSGYFERHKVPSPTSIGDAQFARRVYLDTVGLLPTPEAQDSFVADPAPDKRRALVKRLLADNRGYAEHWLTFWNDLLRNDYKGTGFIDGGRRQISGWLYSALLQNKPFDQFVRELVNPTPATLGFTAGILWRGNVNASMTPPMQAAQNISQVFMGVNLKCASCHDSFINDWALADAYGMAAVYSDDPLELVHCDKPTGKKAAMRFLYPELGKMDPDSPKAERLARFAELMTSKENGRLARTVINRLWTRLIGRGLVEPVDDMEQPSWNPELLDLLAEDFVAHGYDLKRTIGLILTSQAYQMPAAEVPPAKEEYVFRGPLPRRMTAEQFSDAISALSGEWATLPSTLEFDLSGDGLLGSFADAKWIWTDEPVSIAGQRAAARTAQSRAANAATKAARAKQLVDAGAPEAGEAIKQAAAAAEEATAAMKAVEAAAGSDDSHRIIFRKRINLDDIPTRAYATAIVSQGYDLLVNGEIAKPTMIDGSRNGRVRLFDLRARLKKGDNVIVISAASHTEKSMNETERKEFPQSTKHLNKQSGVAFYLRAAVNGKNVEVVSDSSWRVRRAPDGDWGGAGPIESDWKTATLLPNGVAPVDEGPGLQPIKRKDFANEPVELASALRPAASTAALADRARSSMLSADPLALALDRPNREQIATTRLTVPTTIQALEMTNGKTLDGRLRSAANRSVKQVQQDASAWLNQLFRYALGREPVQTERELTLAMLGDGSQPEHIADVYWGIIMLPEFQIID